MAWHLNLGKGALSKREKALLILEAIILCFTVAVLGITVTAANGMKSALHFISVPAKLGWNIAVAVITLLVELALMVFDVSMPKFWHKAHRVNDAPTVEGEQQPQQSQRVSYASNGSRPASRPSQYSPWTRLSIILVLCLLWIGAIVSSVYTCNDLCPSTNRQGFVTWRSMCCDCTTSSVMLCTIFEPGADVIFTGIESDTGQYQATQALDAIVFVLLLGMAVICLTFKWKDSSVATQFDPPTRQPRRSWFGTSVGHTDEPMEL